MLQPELSLDCGGFVERDVELADVEVRYDEITEHEGRRFGLATERDHLIHEDLVTAHFAGFELYAVGFEVAECFFAPWAAGFDI